MATASDDGAPSDGAPSVKVRRRGVACTGTAEVVATTGTAGGDVPLRAELGSDMPNQLRSAKGTDCGGVQRAQIVAECKGHRLWWDWDWGVELGSVGVRL